MFHAQEWEWGQVSGPCGAQVGGVLAPLNTCIPASVSPPLSEGLRASPGISLSSGLSGAWSRCVSGRGQARCMSGWDWAAQGCGRAGGQVWPKPESAAGISPQVPHLLLQPLLLTSKQ